MSSRNCSFCGHFYPEGPLLIRKVCARGLHCDKTAMWICRACNEAFASNGVRVLHGACSHHCDDVAPGAELKR